MVYIVLGVGRCSAKPFVIAVRIAEIHVALALARVQVDEQRVVGGSEPALADIEVHAREGFGFPRRSEKREPRRAGQRDLLFRRAEDGLQFAAPERGNQQQQEADRHAAKGDHHRRRAAGQRPLDHRAGDAHARHGERHEERFLLIVHGVSLSFNAFAFFSMTGIRKSEVFSRKRETAQPFRVTASP